MWHSVCITWQKSTSTCTAYVDGKTNHRRSFDGCWGNSDVEFNGEPVVLGQSISSDGVFLESDSFTGNITRVNMWDYVINEEQVYSLATVCSHAPGNVLRWPSFRNEPEQGSVIKTVRSHCSGSGKFNYTPTPPPPPPRRKWTASPCVAFGFVFTKLSYLILSLSISYLIIVNSWRNFLPCLNKITSPYLTCLLPYLILSHLILSYLISSYFILSHLISSHLISSHLISSLLVSLRLVSSRHVSSYLILSFLIWPDLISSHLIVSYLILSYLILSWWRRVVFN